MTETDATLFTTLPNKTTTAHTIMINKLPPKKWQKQVTEKTFQEMYINVGMANCEKRPKQERDDIRFTHIAIPTSFYPSPTHGPTQHPLHTDYLSIHHSRNPQNSISQYPQLNNCTTCTNTIIQSPCSVTIVMAPSSQSNNQKSLKLQSNASAKQPTASEPDLSLRPPHATACSFHTYFHIITCLILCYMMH